MRNMFSVVLLLLLLLLLDGLLDVAILGIGGGGRSGLFSAQVNGLGEVEEEDEFSGSLNARFTSTRPKRFFPSGGTTLTAHGRLPARGRHFGEVRR